MSTPKSYLAIDLGAESGRGVLSEYDGERVTLRELGRFPTSMGEHDLGPDGVRRWDIERISSEIRGLLAQASAETEGRLSGVGVDSWGVDFGFIDGEGKLLAAPVCYRDLSHIEAHKATLARMSREEIWTATGIQDLAFNTLYQLAAIQKREPALLEKADRFLMISDLLHQQLTGSRTAGVEATNGSTTQLMVPGAGAWNTALLDKLGLPSHFLGPITAAGANLGLTPGGVPVITPATHDTASAVVAVPAEAGDNWAFLSSGTWSLLGAELPGPIMTADAMRLGFSNEGGVAGTTRFLKNIMGMWLVQECRRSLKKTTGREYSYPELVALAEAAPEEGPLIDATSPRFLAPSDMAEEIREACRVSGQPEPQDVGALIRCCLASLALAYRRGLAELQRLLGRRFDTLHIIGGGSQNLLLNQWTADACGVRVLAGPSEATALGNALGQLVGSGVIANWAEARDVSRRSFSTTLYVQDSARHARWAEREHVIIKLWEKSST